MQTIKEISSGLDKPSFGNVLRQTTYRQVYHYIQKKGYTICSVTPLSNSENWFAVLTDKKNFILATVFAQGKEIEGLEAKVM